MGKIIQFPKQEEKGYTEEEIVKLDNMYAEFYDKLYNNSTNRDEELDKMYEEFYSDEEWVEEFYNSPYSSY